MGKLVKSTVSCVILRVSCLTCFLNNVPSGCVNDGFCFDRILPIDFHKSLERVA